MLYKATKSFSGLVNMIANEIKEIPDKEIAKDLLNAGYIIEYKATSKPKKKKGEKK